MTQSIPPDQKINTYNELIQTQDGNILAESSLLKAMSSIQVKIDQLSQFLNTTSTSNVNNSVQVPISNLKKVTGSEVFSSKEIIANVKADQFAYLALKSFFNEELIELLTGSPKKETLKDGALLVKNQGKEKSENQTDVKSLVSNQRALPNFDKKPSTFQLIDEIRTEVSQLHKKLESSILSKDLTLVKKNIDNVDKTLRFIQKELKALLLNLKENPKIKLEPLFTRLNSLKGELKHLLSALQDKVSLEKSALTDLKNSIVKTLSQINSKLVTSLLEKSMNKQGLPGTKPYPNIDNLKKEIVENSISLAGKHVDESSFKPIRITLPFGLIVPHFFQSKLDYLKKTKKKSKQEEQQEKEEEKFSDK